MKLKLLKCHTVILIYCSGLTAFVYKWDNTTSKEMNEFKDSLPV